MSTNPFSQRHILDIFSGIRRGLIYEIQKFSFILCDVDGS